MNEPVSVTSCKSYEPDEVSEALDRVLSAIGGLDFIAPGDRVAIKANLVSAMKPEKAATTHPALLAELTRRIKALGAEVVIGDSPGGPFNAPYLERVYSASGMKEAEAAGARLNDNFERKEAVFPEGKACRSFTYTAWLDDADHIIDFCKLKSHGMMGLSCGIKNMFGAVPGTVKPEYHYRFPDHDEFADMLVDLNEYFKPKLYICDAVECMEGNGPTMGDPKHLGALIASRSGSALDLLAANLIGLDPQYVPTLRAGMRRGLIPESVSALDIRGSCEELYAEDFKLIKAPKNIQFSYGSGLIGSVSAWFVSSCLRSSPGLGKGCVGCGKCAEICPAKSITIKNRKAKIDRTKCIRCFCCQEFCPKGAMVVKRPVIARIVRKL